MFLWGGIVCKMSSPTTNVDERTQLLASPSNDATTISTVDPKSPVLLAVDAEAGAIYGTVTNDNEIKPPLRSVAGIIAVLLLGVYIHIPQCFHLFWLSHEFDLAR